MADQESNMTWWMGVLLMQAVLMVGAAALLWRCLQKVTALEARLRQVNFAVPVPDEPRPIISVEILNPFELAVRENALAGPAAKVAPKLIERVVISQAAKQLTAELIEKGVKAEVRTHFAKA